jgi:hypothetical protein
VIVGDKFAGVDNAGEFERGRKPSSSILKDAESFRVFTTPIYTSFAVD